MVFPNAIDLEITQRCSLVTKVQFFGDATTRVIARDDADLQTMQTEIIERTSESENERFRHVSVTSLCTVDPVPDVCVLKWTPLDIAQIQFTSKSIVHEKPESIAGSELPLSVTYTTTTDERPSIYHHIGDGARLPFGQPLARTDSNPMPLLEVIRAKRAQRHPRAAQDEI